jgi:hypothetical protein
LEETKLEPVDEKLRKYNTHGLWHVTRMISNRMPKKCWIIDQMDRDDLENTWTFWQGQTRYIKASLVTNDDDDDDGNNFCKDSCVWYNLGSCICSSWAKGMQGSCLECSCSPECNFLMGLVGIQLWICLVASTLPCTVYFSCIICRRPKHV